MISGYSDGSDLTIMNCKYHGPKKDMETGKYSKDNMIVVFKDNATGKKHHRIIYEPEYTFYRKADEDMVGYNEFFIDKDKVVPITCKYKDLDKTIAESVGQLNVFYDNIKCGNRGANKRFHLDERIFGSDIHINNYYRKIFSEKYINNITPIDKCYLDIEVDGTYTNRDFPLPGEVPVNAVSIMVDKENTLYTFLLRDQKNPLIAKFEESLSTYDFIGEFKAFLENNVGGWKKMHKFKLKDIKYKIIFFDEEIDLIENVFRIINIKQPDFVLAWNMAFDIPYIIARLENLGVDPKEVLCHPDFKEKYCTYFFDEENRSDYEQRGDFADISSYSVYLDQLIQFASRRKGQSAFESVRLDDIGYAICGVRKLSYKHITQNIAELPYLDYKTFVMYNMMDVLVQKCIEEMAGDINYVFSKAISNDTMYQKVHRQTVYLANRAISSFMKNNNVIAGNNANKFNKKPEEKFPGAFVAPPTLVSDTAKVKIGGIPIRVYKNANDFDYKRLYPSIAQEFNTAPNTQIGMIQIPEQIYKYENPNNDETFSRAGMYVEDLASKNYLLFCHRWLNMGNYREVYDDIVEYFTNVKTPNNGTMDLRLSQGIRDIAFRLKENELLPIVQRHKGPIKIVDRYLAMPKEVEVKLDEYRKGMRL